MSGWSVRSCLLFAVAVLLFFPSAWADAQTRLFGELGPPQWQMEEEGEWLRFSLQIPGFALKPAQHGWIVELEGRSYRASERVVIPPRVAKVFRTSKGVEPHVDWEVTSSEVISNLTLVGITEGESSEWLPEPMVSLTQAWMGTQQLIRIECCPIQYNSKDQTLRFNRQFKGVIKFQ